ncbi:ferrochelatase-2, chloroplastic-like protein [Tanacetum coccineum]
MNTSTTISRIHPTSNLTPTYLNPNLSSNLKLEVPYCSLQNLRLNCPIQSKGLAEKTFCSVGICTYPLSDAESHSHVEEERYGVLLLNLGGPDTLRDVRPFLYNLFADPADAIKSKIKAKKVSANVYVAMRYWHPFTKEAAH